ncbi:MAG: Nif3-like dinuclear metal center hexameric protein [Zoogloeaceae bacterium]|jgi:dinuclear metal center YbgI/SA1388 family protein|nr:Nif3-like dinuclear metal center hexameric protein [Zoogloeaceae bacterium]
MHREELRAYMDNLLEAPRFQDYCPNGLQVEGRAELRQVVCGVTASQALLDEAIRRRADAVLVHHGWFWKSDDSRVTGIRRRRLATILGADLNLFAYHLPLDAHPELGNNAELARRAGWRIDGRFGDQGIGFTGTLSAPANAAQLGTQLEALLGRATLLIGNGERQIARLAWCSGGAQDYFEQAIQTGADCFVSGEISEQTVHLARESGIPYIAAGHHATERFGIMALAAHLQNKLGLDCQFVDIDNPV